MNYLSRHARTRCQQRCIPPMVIDLLFEYGATESDGRGAKIIHFNRRSKKRLKHYMGSKNSGFLSKHMNAYLIYADGQVITAGYRDKKIHRKSRP